MERKTGMTFAAVDMFIWFYCSGRLWKQSWGWWQQRVESVMTARNLKYLLSLSADAGCTIHLQIILVYDS
jgi:hypothetical protein